MEAVDDGVSARLETVTLTVWPGTSELFDGLARDFRGWEGERVWGNNHLVVTATFGSGRHMYLGWTLRSGLVPGDIRGAASDRSPARAQRVAGRLLPLPPTLGAVDVDRPHVRAVR